MCINDKVDEIKVKEMPKLCSKNLFLNFCLRVYELLIKLLNIRTVVFGVGTYLVINKNIDMWVWLILSAVFMGEKYVRLIKDLLTEIKN